LQDFEKYQHTGLFLSFVRDGLLGNVIHMVIVPVEVLPANHDYFFPAHPFFLFFIYPHPVLLGE